MKQPIKILHVVHSLGVGGLENGVVNLINSLDGDRFAHVICCLTRSGKLAERLRSKDVEIVEVGLCAEKFRFPILKLRRLFCQLQPEILHTRGWSTVDAILAGKIAGVKRLIHGEHGREAFDPEGQNWKRKAVRRALSPCVDRFITVSDDLRRWLTSSVGIAEKKVVTIHNGVDTEKFAPLREAERAEGRGQLAVGRKIALRQEIGLPSDGLLIGTVGRLDPVKDHDNLLRAFAQISKLEPSTVLTIVGDGPLREQLTKLSVTLGQAGKVKFMGEREDVATLMKALDVFVLSSIAEGISNTILEAMATGLPIVATQVGGNPELVEDGVTGQLIPARNTEALTDALLTYLQNPDLRETHGRMARQRAEDRFSLKRMASQYEKVYLAA